MKKIMAVLAVLAVVAVVSYKLDTETVSVAKVQPPQEATEARKNAEVTTGEVGENSSTQYVEIKFKPRFTFKQ